ncbi:hypothetical protein D9611_004674 [Ephemerocybe angulata]|uniref:Uncharacterized protein n=1 Tax=Ephemerocybe angulata TaxID=980116 RepID=A0A8H5B3M3_9AGAR|nr:hypothetical protein D9611_004674 [Tulosesus angulatus]
MLGSTTMFSPRLFQSCCSMVARAATARPAPSLTGSLARTLATRSGSDRRPDTGNIGDIVDRATIGFGSMPPIPPMEEDPLQGADQIWKKKSQEALRQAELVPPAHAYSGRSVEVESGKVADAIRNLEGILNRNKVRLRLRQTQRHEKRGEKLRRLKSERWRNQFAASVREKVQLVTKIRDRGA